MKDCLSDSKRDIIKDIRIVAFFLFLLFLQGITVTTGQDPIQETPGDVCRRQLYYLENAVFRYNMVYCRRTCDTHCKEGPFFDSLFGKFLTTKAEYNPIENMMEKRVNQSALKALEGEFLKNVTPCSAEHRLRYNLDIEDHEALGNEQVSYHITETGRVTCGTHGSKYNPKKADPLILKRWFFE